MDIRKSLNILNEASNPIDKQQLLNQVNSTWIALKKIPSANFKLDQKISNEILEDLKTKKEYHDKERQKYLLNDPTDDIGQFEISNFIDQTADSVVKFAFGYGKKEIAEMHDKYQRLCAEHFEYEDNSFNYIEDSQYIHCLDAQESIVQSMDFFKPSNLTTYKTFLSSCDKLINSFNEPIQTFEPMIAESVQEQLNMIFPVIFLVLKIK